MQSYIRAQASCLPPEVRVQASTKFRSTWSSYWVGAEPPQAAAVTARATHMSRPAAVERGRVGRGFGMAHPYHAAMPSRQHALRLVRAPAALTEVLEAAAAAAGRDPVYLVGGALRDLRLGRDEITDVDLAVEGDAAGLADRLWHRMGPDARLTKHRAFETSTVRAEGLRVDVARTRAEHYPHPGALPVVEPAGIDEDLRRRDFTVNAMAQRLGDGGAVLDPTGGRADLAAGLIRVLHPGSFRDDPTRVFRAVRYAARLGFRLEPDTERWARRCVKAGDVGKLSGGRMRSEVLAMLGEDTAAAGLALAERLGVCAAIAGGLDCGAQTRALFDRLDEIRLRVHPRAPAWRCRLALLCREMAPADVAALTHRLALRRSDAAAVRAGAAPPRLPARSLPAAIAETYSRLPADAALVAAAEGSAAAELYLDRLRGVRLHIDGRVLRDELGLAESPRVGEVLRELLRRKRNGELESRAAELEAARELVAEGGR